MTTLSPFHLAVPVDDLEAARTFYGNVLGCEEGRSDTHWIDFNFFGHQFVVHYSDQKRPDFGHNDVDGHAVPIPHFGVVLEWEEWQGLSQRLQSAGVEFVIEPYIRFEGLPGEQATMFFLDPASNALEFKAFKDRNQLFAK